MPKFTVKQQGFIDAYEGNASEAAKKAGYSKKTAKSQGQRLLTNVDIAAAIQEREKARENKVIADREERQAFWSEVFRGEIVEKVPVIKNEDGERVYVVEEIPSKMSDRLKASELLGRSEADFVDRKELKFIPGEGLKELLNEIWGRSGSMKPKDG